jgi:hypothetical protein
VSGAMRDFGGWRGAWLIYAALLLAAAVALFLTKDRFLRMSDARQQA